MLDKVKDLVKKSAEDSKTLTNKALDLTKDAAKNIGGKVDDEVHDKVK